VTKKTYYTNSRPPLDKLVGLYMRQFDMSQVIHIHKYIVLNSFCCVTLHQNETRVIYLRDGPWWQRHMRLS